MTTQNKKAVLTPGEKTAQTKKAPVKKTVPSIKDFLSTFEKKEKLVAFRRTVSEHINKIEKLSDVDHGDLDENNEDYFISIGYNGNYRDNYKIHNKALLEDIVSLLNERLNSKIQEIDKELLAL